ncbi:DegV family protein with EDD domain [Lysinibacillus composti]|uniref:DegV family protein n=1 Tax=Lysinibacillus composti TaxID=720633 RepID=A0A3N9UIX2_9BACI|nr:DegV family protein [Lysinibacillus composti]MBM7607924.1 DegV family protein with EDD domain [Lysinibacillus composti]RQW75388.1 DegV family protein [Lysinibacillus composti]
MKLFADSGSDLPKEFYEQHNIELFPLRVQLNGNEYQDVKDINSKEVYDAMRQGVTPKTSQVSPEIFLNAFEELAKNKEEGLYIAFSSNLSGTYNTAVMIATQLREQYPDFKLNIIDSKCASLGCGLLVKEAATLRDQGVAFNEVVTRVDQLAKHMTHLFTVENLDYLAAGGRISKSSAFIGGLLSIKPILHVEDGRLVPLEKIRGRKKAINRIIEMMAERGGDFTNKIVGISHGDDLAFVQDVQSLIQEKLNPKSIEISMVGSVIGAHAGPGTIAIFFADKDYKEVLS